MISINISELIWTVINFFLLLFLLKRFLYTPILRFTAERQARIDAGLEAERAARAQLAENEERLAGKKAESRQEAKRIVQRVEQAASQRREEALRQAREEADEARKREADRLELQRREEAERLTMAQGELAQLLAGRLLGEEQA